jgi:heterotetrameric sarcosine oxidase delta subunit
MRIKCPLCGDRGLEEFIFHGDAAPVRPQQSVPLEAWTDYVYLRDNTYGISKGRWYHSAGCHAWLIIERSAISHRIVSVQLAKDAK